MDRIPDYRIIMGDANGAWAERAFNWTVGDQATGIGLQRNGETVAIALFDSFRGSDISLHFARHPDTTYLPREYVYSVFAYPFVQLGVARITANIRATDDIAAALVKKAGFQFETSIMQACYGSDMHVYCLWRKDCRFLTPQWKGKFHAHLH